MAQTATQRRLVRVAASMNQKAARLGIPGRITAGELGQILVESEGRCSYCAVELDSMEGSFDHVVAFAQGGANLASNIVRCCHICNRTKGFTKSPEDLALYEQLRVTCPVDGTVFRPRWADWRRDLGRYCSRRCAGTVGGRA